MTFIPKGQGMIHGLDFIVYIHHSYVSMRGHGEVIEEVFDKNPQLKENLKKVGTDYCIALIWGQDGADCVDLWIYTDVKDKKQTEANPDMDVLIFKDGELGKIPRTTCGQSVIVLGLEEQYRIIDCQSLNDYLSRPLLDGRPTRGPELPEYLITKE